MQQVGIIQSMQVGTPTCYGSKEAKESMERFLETSFVRVPSPQPRWLYKTHLEGNVQADTKNHGQPDQVLLFYAAVHYPLWQQELQLPAIGPGGFGENITVSDLTEETVYLDDIYAIGDARIQITGPRYPCSKIERRWQTPGLTARVAETGRTGWYCRVLQEGLIEPNMPIFLAERSCHEWNMAIVNEFAHGRNQDRELAQALVSSPHLDPWWEKIIMHHFK